MKKTGMPLRSVRSVHRILGGLAVVLGVSHAATAGENGGAPSLPPSPRYQQECGTCHTAFRPDLMSAASWQRVMGNLDKHFGTDASLDPATLKELSTWLAANGATGKRARQEPPEDRITRSAWFVRKHDEVPAAIWKLPAVKSAVNCAACHPQADQGDFNERNIRIPR